MNGFNVGIGLISEGYNEYDQAQFEKFGEWRVYLEKIEENEANKIEINRINIPTFPCQSSSFFD